MALEARRSEASRRSRGRPAGTRLGTRLLYGLGSVAFGIKDNGFQTVLLIFYNQVVGLPPALVGLAIMIALVADAVLDPVIGLVSDNLRTPWGRRHPLMYASALPLALSYLLLWRPPQGSQTTLFLYLLGVSVLVRAFVSLYEAPSAALAPELTTDYGERTALSGYRVFFAWFGGLAMSFLAFTVFLKPGPGHPVGQLNPEGYLRYGVTSALVMGTTILVSAIGTHGRIRTLRAPPAERLGAFQILREAAAAVRNPSLLALLVATLFSAAATGLAFSMSLYFYTFFWGLTSVQISLFVVNNLASALLAVGLARAAARRDKRRGSIVLLLMGLALSSAPLALRLAGAFPPNGSPLLFPLLLVFSLFGLAGMIAASITGASMMADVVEDEELRSGRRSEGLFFALSAFVTKAVSGLGVFLSSAVLALVRFPAHAVPGAVDPAIIRNLALVYLPLTLGLFLPTAVSLAAYRITRTSHEETLKDLAKAAAAGPSSARP